jgi:cytochrome o ubiquinol oxidase subunit I
MAGPVIGVAGAVAAFGLVWHMWWLVIVGLLVVIVTVIARGFARDVEHVITAAEVERTEMAWLGAVAAAKPILRQAEMSSANEGLAKVSA